MSRRQQVLASYRSLLRSAQIAFNQDIRMRVAAHQQMRAQYEVGKQELQDKKEDYEEIDKRLEHAAGVSLVLRSNIAQGVLQKGDESKHNEPNTLTAELDDGPTATTEQGVFKLRLHKHSELGDNEAVKGGKTNLAGRGKRIDWSQVRQ
ncbi:uncharacterized protein V2V93DRAFT_366139 [Kockiozyma suomiensis]|uniref:uncharacterized protein n=1 Tax=Kockiozyma suomiensis TaxID=1337062 RepID=UPI003342EF5B